VRYGSAVSIAVAVLLRRVLISCCLCRCGFLGGSSTCGMVLLPLFAVAVPLRRVLISCCLYRCRGLLFLYVRHGSAVSIRCRCSTSPRSDVCCLYRCRGLLFLYVRYGSAVSIRCRCSTSPRSDLLLSLSLSGSAVPLRAAWSCCAVICCCCRLAVAVPLRRVLIHSASAYPRLQARVKRTIAYTPTDDGTAGFPTVCDSFKPLGRHSV